MEPKDWISLAALAFATGSFFYSHYRTRQDKSEALIGKLKDDTWKRIADGQSDVDDLRNRTTSLEMRVQTLPTKDSFHQLELAVAEVKGGMGKMEAELKPISTSVARIEKFLLDSVTSKGRSR